jgi:hypothetical protein
MALGRHLRSGTLAALREVVMLDCKRAWNAISVVALIGMLPWLSTAASGQTQAPAFVAPPRTIADITAILDQEKPDPKVAAKMRAEADVAQPANLGRGELAKFLYGRCTARSQLGDYRGAVAADRRQCSPPPRSGAAVCRAR